MNSRSFFLAACTVSSLLFSGEVARAALVDDRPQGWDSSAAQFYETSALSFYLPSEAARRGGD
jgi:hypothetical protein